MEAKSDMGNWLVLFSAMMSHLSRLISVSTKVSWESNRSKKLVMTCFKGRDCLTAGMREKIHSELISSLAFFFSITAAKFVLPSPREGMSIYVYA